MSGVAYHYLGENQNLKKEGEMDLQLEKRSVYHCCRINEYVKFT